MQRFGIPILVLMALPRMLQAQTSPRPQVRLLWDGIRLVRVLPVTEMQGPTTLQILHAHGPMQEIQTPPGFGSISLHEGVFYAVERSLVKDMRPNLPPKPAVLVTSLDGRHWSACASFASDPEAPRFSSPIPLGRDRFLVRASAFKPFEVSGRPTLLGVARIRKGELVYEEALDMGFPKGCTLPLLLSAQLTTTRVGDAWVTLHPRSGNYWVAKVSEAGRVSLQSQRLFPEVNCWQEKPPYDHAVIALQPDREGGALLASRSESGVREGLIPEKGQPVSPTLRVKGLAPGQRIPAEQVDAHRKALQAASQDSITRFPDLWWWSFDVESRRFNRTGTPAGAPAKLASTEAFKAFTFEFDARGRLQVETRRN